MWLTSSSIGRKLVMAVTGACLVLFVTFHCLMNAVAIACPAAYNVICEFLGANWYALAASAGLALLFFMPYGLLCRTVRLAEPTVMPFQLSLQQWNGRRRTCSCWV